MSALASSPLRPCSDRGLGDVYLTHDPDEPDSPLFLKLLGPADPTQDVRFDDLSRRLRALSGANVPRTHDTGSHDGRRFVTVEAPPVDDLRSLDDWIEGHRQSARTPHWSVAFALFDQLCGALDAGARAKCAHRGLSPRSALISPLPAAGAYRLWLVDFELAPWIVEPGEGPDPAYAAPERAPRALAEQQRADVFSLAVTLVAMLTGAERPDPGARNVPWSQFVERGPGEVTARLRALRADVPDAVWNTVAKALAPAPAQRPPHAGAFYDLVREAARVARVHREVPVVEAPPPAPAARETRAPSRTAPAHASRLADWPEFERLPAQAVAAALNRPHEHVPVTRPAETVVAPGDDLDLTLPTRDPAPVPWTRSPPRFVSDEVGDTLMSDPPVEPTLAVPFVEEDTARASEPTTAWHVPASHAPLADLFATEHARSFRPLAPGSFAEDPGATLTDPPAVTATRPQAGREMTILYESDLGPATRRAPDEGTLLLEVPPRRPLTIGPAAPAAPPPDPPLDATVPVYMPGPPVGFPYAPQAPARWPSHRHAEPPAEAPRSTPEPPRPWGVIAVGVALFMVVLATLAVFLAATRSRAQTSAAPVEVSPPAE